ncbi:MAG: PrpF domain-containing protein [Lachnospiraceae bacterium]
MPVRNQQGGNRGNADAARLELLETVRELAAVKLGLNDDYKKSAWETPGISKMTFVAEPDAYETADGTTIRKEEIDLLSRMMSMQKSHPSYAMTGAMCTAAAVVPGSVVAQVLKASDVEKGFSLHLFLSTLLSSFL